MKNLKLKEVEEKINLYKKINERIKALEEEKETLKKLLVNSYFEKHQEYIAPSGKVLASYTVTIRNMFNTKALKEELPDLYVKYTYEQEIKMLLVK